MSLESTENLSSQLSSSQKDPQDGDLAKQLACLVAEAIRTGIIPVTGGKRILDGVVVEHSEFPSGEEQMVNLEDVLKSEGPERRVDNHMLVVYLGQLKEQVTNLEGRLNDHMVAEETHEQKIKELIDLLMSFKGFIKVAKWVTRIIAGGAAILLTIKNLKS